VVADAETQSSAEGARQHAPRGKYKGSANLPEAQHMDVRREIARVAGVCDRNVANVRTILKVAHPRLIEALRNSTPKNNRAIQFCKLPRAAQLEQFIRYSEERATNTVIRRSIACPQEEKISLDVVTVADRSLYEVLEEMGSERQFWQVISFLACYLD